MTTAAETEPIVTRLSCGATLIVEPMASVRSAAVEILIPAGNAHDPADRLGRAAMYSELLLRGAGDLDSRQQADAFDRVGASRSCDAGRRFIRLGSSMLGERFAEAAPLIVDTVRRPSFREDAVEAARLLTMQAIDSLLDDPQQRAVLAARARHFRPPFERSGYGEKPAIEAMTRDELVAGWGACARPGGVVIAVAGNIEPGAVHEVFESLTGDWSGEAPGFETGGEPPRGYAHEKDDSAQVQIVLVHDAPREVDDDSVRERLLTRVLSGGMSCRLFTEVREKRGLCYAVQAGYTAEKDFGSVPAYVGTTPERAQQSLDVLHAELERIGTAAGAVDPEEFERATMGMKSRLVFSGESTSARARAIAGDFVTIGRPRTLSERAAEIDAVTLDDLNRYAASRDLGRPTIQTLGPSELAPPTGAA